MQIYMSTYIALQLDVHSRKYMTDSCYRWGYNFDILFLLFLL